MSRWRPSATALALAALALGLGLGLAANALQSAPLIGLAARLAPLGNLWVDVLKVTVVPLVLAQLLLGVAGAGGGRATGRMGLLSFTAFVTLLFAAGIVTALVMPPILSVLPLAGASLGPPAVGAVAPAAAHPSLYQWLTGLVPRDPLGAARRGEILPLIVLALLFALALTRVRAEARQPLLDCVRAVSEAVLVLLRWILALLPPAVFCLTFALAARTGPASVGAIGVFVAIVIGLLVGFTVLLYPLAALVGRVPLARFARAVAPAQMVAVGSRSSLVSLPSMVLGAGQHLGLPPAVTGFVLPLSVAVFKLNRTVSSTAKLLFLASLYGIPLGPVQVMTFVAAVVLLSFGTPGVPSTGSTTTLPLYLSLGIPLEGVVILGAVDAVPDVFKTLLNVTADMTVATMVARGAGDSGAPAPLRGRAGEGPSA